ncbi:MAG: cation:proton antiporter, partial [Gammaproteobacteria bacterium]|nr:cation:proton antiporter [Gammaproteobacteria bacterium]
NIALLMIGFLLGGKLSLSSFKKDRSQIIWISLSAALGTTILVALALIAVGISKEIAILLGCTAAATAPAATVETVLESNKDSHFSKLLLAIVAIDDVWALIFFSLGLAFVSIMSGAQDSAVYLGHASYEIFGALILGGIIGIPAAFLTGRVKPGQPMLTEALGLVFVCGGISLWLDVSFLIAAITMGAVVTNLAKHHEYPFHEIENIERPFLILFFILAGASLEISMLAGLGLIGVVYILSRVAGKIIGAWIGARAAKANIEVQHWMGLALMPQAGVAIGMALLIANRFPEYQQTILSIVISTTVIFELVGPVFTRMALNRTTSLND